MTAEEAIKYIQETAKKGEPFGFFVTAISKEDLKYKFGKLYKRYAC